jgi:hypothetical protein
MEEHERWRGCSARSSPSLDRGVGSVHGEVVPAHKSGSPGGTTTREAVPFLTERRKGTAFLFTSSPANDDALIDDYSRTVVRVAEPYRRPWSTSTGRGEIAPESDRGSS